MNTKYSFSKPNTCNSFRKTQKKYPPPKSIDIVPTKNTNPAKSQRLDQKSLQKNKEKKCQENLGDGQFERKLQRIHILQHNPIKNQKFYLYLQNPFPIMKRGSQAPHINKTCLWHKQLQNSTWGTNKRIIEIKQIDYVISGWNFDAYPNSLALCCQNMWGYLRANNTPTDRIGILQLSQVSPTYEDDQIRVLEMRYSMRNKIEWQIPQQLTQLFFYVTADQDEDPLILPLPNPITIQITIRYE